MSNHKLPKAVQSAINCRAFKIATTDAYASIKRDLEYQAQLLMSEPHRTSHQVIAFLESDKLEHTYAQH